jgi:hypothetical protein
MRKQAKKPHNPKQLPRVRPKDVKAAKKEGRSQ